MNSNLSLKNPYGEYDETLLRLLKKNTNPKLGLKRMFDVLDTVGFRKGSMKVVQIVGTNGKGSTTAFLESILRNHNISVGSFISPHLHQALERIRINGKPIDKETFTTYGKQVLRAINSFNDEPSFFECLLAMALLVFKDAGLDVCILEAGLGGRLDATTAVKADLLGVTPIDLDHQQILGENIGAIANEKIRAARPNQTVVVAPQCEEAIKSITIAQKQILFNLYHAKPCAKPLGLYGEHQTINAGLALRLFQKMNLLKTEKGIAKGLISACWPGRLEVINKGAPIVFDGAHNQSGMKSLVVSLRNHPVLKDRPKVLVYGSLKGDNAFFKVKVLNEILCNIRRVYLHHPQNKRALNHRELREIFYDCGFNEDHLRDYKSLKVILQEENLAQCAVIVCGSLYTVGAIRGELLGIRADPKLPFF